MIRILLAAIFLALTVLLLVNLPLSWEYGLGTFIGNVGLSAACAAISIYLMVGVYRDAKRQ